MSNALSTIYILLLIEQQTMGVTKWEAQISIKRNAFESDCHKSAVTIFSGRNKKRTKKMKMFDMIE